MAIGQGSRSCTYTRFLSQGVEIELKFYSMDRGFQDTGRVSKFPYMGWKLVISQSSRRCTYTLFLPEGVKIELILALRAAGFEI